MRTEAEMQVLTETVRSAVEEIGRGSGYGRVVIDCADTCSGPGERLGAVNTTSAVVLTIAARHISLEAATETQEGNGFLRVPLIEIETREERRYHEIIVLKTGILVIFNQIHRHCAASIVALTRKLVKRRS